MNKEKTNSLQALVKDYGDLVYDLGFETLKEKEKTDRASRKIFETWQKHWTKEIDGPYRRAWALRLALDVLRSEQKQRGPGIHRNDPHTEKDLSKKLSNSLSALAFDPKATLLLSSKHGVPMEEVSIALKAPVESLVIGKEIALRKIDTASSKLPPFSSLPTMKLPENLASQPFHEPAPKLHLNSIFRRSTWQRAPWYWKSMLETLSIACLAFGVITIASKVRQQYEDRLTHRLEGFDPAWERENTSVEADQAPSDLASTQEGDNEQEFEEIPGAETQESLADPNRPLKVGPSEIWRMNLRTENPMALKQKIIDLLKTELALPPTTEGIQGFTAPGGIQFDLLIPREKVLQAKEKLEEISQSGQSKDSFTWYRHRSKKPVPEGQARVVIWISQ